VERAARRYLVEFMTAMCGYAVVLAISVSLLRGSAADGAIWRTPVALAPMVPAVGVLIAVVRQLGRIDELQRRIQFEALAFAFGGTALVTFSYGFLENAGYPHLSWFVVWPVMATLWLVGLVVARRRYA
jgi:hypothetical protein